MGLDIWLVDCGDDGGVQLGLDILRQSFRRRERLPGIYVAPFDAGFRVPGTSSAPTLTNTGFELVERGST